MRKTTKILLAISLTAFALGFTDILWGFGKPIGAIFFGGFLIFKVLEKEMALFDEEQRSNVALAERYGRPIIETTGCPTPERARAAWPIPARAR
jgi:hypothetical protein